jgi:hypothetical protein
MKKFALATVLALAVGFAQAAEVKVEAQNAVGQNGSADQQVLEVGLKDSFTKNFAGDVIVKQYRTDNTNTLATRLEVGGTGSVGLYGPVTGYTRVALGEKYVSGNAGYSYYSVEPGIAALIAIVPGMSASLGYRFQDAFSSSHNDLTRTWRAKVGYDVTKTSNVYVGYDVQRGDTDQNIVKVGYVHKF